MLPRSREGQTQSVEREHSPANALLRWLILSLAALPTLLAPSLATSLAPSLAAQGAAAQDARGMYGMIVDDVGRPIAGVDVMLRDESGTVASTTTDANGQYRLSHVSADLFSVSVRQAGFVPVARLLREAPAGSFTGDLLNLLPGVPKAPLRTAARCTQYLLNDFPERSEIGDAGASIANIPTQQLKIVMVRTPGNPMPEV